ncbi:MAG: leucine-rich repeat domain-containing protein [Clostridia bacterium]|nr:leucine-rich repeat domain-containing protein [Clostridia bacterium]
MKKVILVFLCCAMLVFMISCDTDSETDNLDTHTSDTQTTDPNTSDSDTSDTTTPCTHTFGEWSVSKAATERKDGEEKRTCSLCDCVETRLLHAKGTEGLLFTLSDDETSYSVSAGTATEGDVFIPAYHNGLPVTSIGYIGFSNSDFEPEDVEIGSYAFFGCADLKTVIIPSTVSTIGDAAFARCASLKSIVLPPSVTVISDGAFMLCEKLESVVIPESVQKIGKWAFACIEDDIFDKYLDDIRVLIPDTQVMLIVREWSILLASGVEIYYLDENGNEILIPNTFFASDDGYCPFNSGNFEIINNNDSTFSVRAGESSNKEAWTELTFDIPQCVSVFIPTHQKPRFTVFYGGKTHEEWEKIILTESENKSLENSVIYYYSETEPTESNKFWHFVDSKPTLW